MNKKVVPHDRFISREKVDQHDSSIKKIAVPQKRSTKERPFHTLAASRRRPSPTIEASRRPSHTLAASRRRPFPTMVS